MNGILSERAGSGTGDPLERSRSALVLAALLGVALGVLITITGQDIRMPGPEMQFDCNDFPGQCRDYPFPYGYLIVMLVLIAATIGLWIALSRQLPGSWSSMPLYGRSVELSDQARTQPTRSRTASQWGALVVDVAVSILAPPALTLGALALVFGAYAAALGFAGAAGVLIALVFALTTSIQTRTVRPAWIAGGAVALTAIIAQSVAGFALLFTGPGLVMVPVIGIAATLLARAAAHESIRESSAAKDEGVAPSSALNNDEGDLSASSWRPIGRCALVVCAVAGLVSVSALMILPAPADRSTPLDQTPPAADQGASDATPSGPEAMSSELPESEGQLPQSGPEPAVHAPATQPLCDPADLSAAFGSVQGALGTRGALLTVVNNSEAACSVSGVPGLRVRADGVDLQVSTQARSSEVDDGVDIPAGGRAHMQLSWRAAGAGEFEVVDMTVAIAGGGVPVDLALGPDGDGLDMDTGTLITCEPWRVDD